jgi:CubicO group peptidase (beta-lactamase class C family)
MQSRAPRLLSLSRALHAGDMRAVVQPIMRQVTPDQMRLFAFSRAEGQRPTKEAKMKFGYAICVSAAATCIAFSAFAQGLPKASKPEEVGFSSERLKRLAAAFQTDVDKGRIPGAVVLIARNGEVAYLEAFGFQDRENKIPMRTDAIFRIASMSKPVTSVAIMMLVEEGKIQIGDPISIYLPELKGLQVGVEKINATTGNPELSLEPVRREMTVQDLLRHTSGLTYSIFGKSLVKQAYTDAKIFDPNQTLAELVGKFSKLPLAHQPGTVWDYSMSTDVLGRVVEVVSGMPFDKFVAERIAKPLGLSDTGFYVPPEKLGRVALPQADPTTNQRPQLYQPNWPSGGGGMVSTASDYVRFSQMLLNGGELDGVRLLSPRIVAFMTSDQLPPDIGYSAEALQLFEPTGLAPTPRLGQSFGLGFMVRTQEGRYPLPGSPGEFYWEGTWCTVFWVNPKEKLIAVLMMQTAPNAQLPHYRSLIRNLVYQALVN